MLVGVLGSLNKTTNLEVIKLIKTFLGVHIVKD